MFTLLVLSSLPGLARSGELDTCRAITSASERLVCYDALAEVMPASTDTTPSPREPSTSISAESLFGRDAVQTSAALQQQTGITPPQILDAEIRSVEIQADGKLLIALQNGQQWKQIDGRPLSLTPGNSIRIRKAAFSSYLLYKQSGGRSIRVRRTD